MTRPISVITGSIMAASKVLRAVESGGAGRANSGARVREKVSVSYSCDVELDGEAQSYVAASAVARVVGVTWFRNHTQLNLKGSQHP